MKKYTIISLILLLFVCQMASAQTIGAKELAKEIKGGDITVVSARKAADYKKVHLPGAVNVWHMDLYKDGDVKGILKSAEEYVNKNSSIVTANQILQIYKNL